MISLKYIFEVKIEILEDNLLKMIPKLGIPSKHCTTSKLFLNLVPNSTAAVSRNNVVYLTS
jgi:hypothetical protein